MAGLTRLYAPFLLPKYRHCLIDVLGAGGVDGAETCVPSEQGLTPATAHTNTILLTIDCLRLTFRCHGAQTSSDIAIYWGLKAATELPQKIKGLQL